MKIFCALGNSFSDQDDPVLIFSMLVYFALAQLGRFYAQTIQNSPLAFDILLGPAYKGIPLVAATAITLANDHQRNVPYCFNCKETQDHGEDGNLIGALLKGEVLLIDDVITATCALIHKGRTMPN